MSTLEFLTKPKTKKWRMVLNGHKIEKLEENMTLACLDVYLFPLKIKLPENTKIDLVKFRKVEHLKSIHESRIPVGCYEAYKIHDRYDLTLIQRYAEDKNLNIRIGINPEIMPGKWSIFHWVKSSKIWYNVNWMHTKQIMILMEKSICLELSCHLPPVLESVVELLVSEEYRDTLQGVELLDHVDYERILYNQTNLTHVKCHVDNIEQIMPRLAEMESVEIGPRADTLDITELLRGNIKRIIMSTPFTFDDDALYDNESLTSFIYPFNEIRKLNEYQRAKYDSIMEKLDRVRFVRTKVATPS